MQHFAIVSMGRTGSTLLVDLLGSHPQIECGNEIIHPKMGMFKEQPKMNLRHFLDMHAYKTDRPIRGFKMPIDWTMHFPSIMEEFRRDAYKILRLRRENPVEHFLSIQLVRKNKNWLSDRTYDHERLTLDPWEWLDFVGTRHTLEWAMDTLCAGMDMLRITYERLMAEETHAEILAFLGADPLKLSTRKVRARTKPTHEVIENYDALVDFFAASPYAGLFPPKSG